MGGQQTEKLKPTFCDFVQWQQQQSSNVVIEKDTWEYIRSRAEHAASVSSNISKALADCERKILNNQSCDVPEKARNAMDPKVLREIGSIAEEIEFEWLCMFFLQGSIHAESHSGYWLPKIVALEKMWCTIDRGIASCLRFLVSYGDTVVPLQRTLQILNWLLKERVTKRNEYYKRIKHMAYKVLEPGWRPIPNRPIDKGGKDVALSKDLKFEVDFVSTMLQKRLYYKG